MSEEQDHAAENEMKLPQGKTCGDCAHVRRCRAFGFTPSETETSCDFHPSRFRLAADQKGTSRS